jgi:hypothetical protein
MFPFFSGFSVSRVAGFEPYVFIVRAWREIICKSSFQPSVASFRPGIDSGEKTAPSDPFREERGKLVACAEERRRGCFDGA